MSTHQRYSDHSAVIAFRPVLFMNAGKGEALALIARYKKDLEEIVRPFYKKTYLETTLQQVLADKPLYIQPL